MENVIDIRTALEQLGTGWQFGGSVTDGTQESWDAVVWEDQRTKPTWDALCAAHTGVSLTRGMEGIDTKYEAKFSALRDALQSALLADGTNMEGTLAALRTEWANLANAKSAEMAALLEA